MKMKTLIGIAIGTIVTVFGFQWYQVHFPSWDEEVLLSDGRMISVHRAQTLNTAHKLIQTELMFELPETGGKVTWSERLFPVIVDAYGGKAYVVGDIRGSDSMFGEYLDPRYLYVAFVYSGGKWKRLPFLDVPQEIRQRENIPGCLMKATHTKWPDKQTGWCESDGTWKIGLDRKISIQTREERARRMLRRVDGRKNADFGSE